MNPIGLIFFLLSAIAVLAVPRKWAPAALLVGCTYMTLGQAVEIASVNFPVYRLILLVGLARCILRQENLVGGLNTIDKMLIFWGVWSIFAGFFHDQSRYSAVYFCGIVFNIGLVYFLTRIWCTDIGEVREVIAIVALLLLPIALEMLLEKASGKNLFAIFGGIPENVLVREGKLRAQGPFLHAILAGTTGATCVPLFIGLWSHQKIIASIGILSGVVMTIASASSGPVMSLLAGVGAVAFWKFRDWTPKVRLMAIGIYLLLLVVMKQPPYYLISRIDISGGSTGFHRVFLIHQTFEHLSEWWLFGTDFTRHWMPMQGIGIDPFHTDITNYYIVFGVNGGLIPMLLLIGILLVGFFWVGKITRGWQLDHPSNSYMVWCFGAAMFAHAVTGISVAYFDQSYIFFWLSVAVISSMYSITQINLAEESISIFVEAEKAILTEDVAVQNREWRRRFSKDLQQVANRKVIKD